VTDRSHGQISCPECDLPAPAGARACSACGYRFLEDRRPGRALALTAALAAAVAAVAVVLIPGGDAARPQDVETGRPADRPRVAVELLSNHPLSTREAEGVLESRFTSDSGDDTAAARCSAREPRPAHAVRHCRIRYPSGAKRQVVVLLDARGRELLSEY
jgi:predicted nucleic acid-binding Zn ribbon protein